MGRQEHVVLDTRFFLLIVVVSLGVFGFPAYGEPLRNLRWMNAFLYHMCVKGKSALTFLFSGKWGSESVYKEPNGDGVFGLRRLPLCVLTCEHHI